MSYAGMASMYMAVWISALILSSNLDVSSGEQAVDCCLKVSHHRIPKKIVTCYREQVRGNGCNINAVVFQTRKGRKLCADPEAIWIKEIIDAVKALPMKIKEKHCQNY